MAAILKNVMFGELFPKNRKIAYELIFNITI